MVLKRTVILSNKGKKYDKAVAFVSIQKDGRGTQALLKCYNLQNFDKLCFGLCENNQQIIKQEFDPSAHEIVFNINTNFDIDGDIGCVIVRVNGEDIEPVIWGKNDCLDVLFPPKEIVRDDKGRFSKKEELFEPPTEKELDRLVTEEMKRQEVAVAKVSDEKEKEPLQGDQGLEGDTFYSLISDQVEEIFNKFPEEERLEKLVPHCKWVKVSYDDKSEYAVGLIYDEEVLKYLAYGVPASKDAEVQEEIRAYSQWIPLDPTSVDSKGFWVMYQDAVTGDSVNLSENQQFA